ncbi:MAG: SPOR domain-containing protein, partial [Luteimonas sp.]
ATTAPAPPVAPEIAAEPLAGASEPAAPLAPEAAPAATAIDRLVAALPLASADASERPQDATFQLATFADRGNAERALASVNGAGIPGARLEDGFAAGRAVWRLRVGPVAAASADALAARLQGLGFGAPQRVP